MRELILRRYSNSDYIFAMDVPDFLEFCKYAIEKEKEEHIRSQWVALLPYMSKQELKFMPFNDYLDQCTGKNIDLRPTDEILRDIEETHRKAKGGQ